MVSAISTNGHKENSSDMVQNSVEKDVPKENNAKENVTDNENSIDKEDDANNENVTDKENNNQDSSETVEKDNQSNASSDQNKNQTDILDGGRVYEIHSDITPDDVSDTNLFTIPGRWIQNEIGWYYLHNDGGFSVNSWEEINGKWYYFDSRGYMFVGWLNYQGHWYYTDSSGAMLTGFQLIKDAWYYFYPTAGGPHGAMATGFVLETPTYRWYYFADNGIMQTGWHKIGDAWYYFNPAADGSQGAMFVGWLNYQGHWYYLTDDVAVTDRNFGKMKTGYFYVKPKDSLDPLAKCVYFSNSDGQMSTGGVKYEYTTCYYNPDYSLLWMSRLLDWNLVGSDKTVRFAHNASDDYQNPHSSRIDYDSYLRRGIRPWNGERSSTIYATSSSSRTVTVTFKNTRLGTESNGKSVVAVTGNDGRMRFDANVFAMLSEENKLDSVTHEFGHALGLDHTLLRDMMYYNLPNYSGGSLSISDKNSLNEAFKRY